MLGHEEQFFNAKYQISEEIKNAIRGVIDGVEGAEDELDKLKAKFTWNAEYSCSHNEDGEVTYEGLNIDVDEIELVNPSEEAVTKQNEAKLKSQQDELLREISRKIKAAKRDGILEKVLLSVLRDA